MFYPRSIASASLGILGFLYGFCFDCIHKFTLLFEENSNNRIPHIENAFHPSRSWKDLETAHKSSQAEIFDWLVFHGCTGCSRAALKRPGFALSLPAPDMTVAWQDSFGSTAWLQAVLRLRYLTMDGVNIRHHWKPHSCFINVAKQFLKEQSTLSILLCLYCSRYYGACSSLLHFYWHGKATQDPLNCNHWLFTCHI